MFGVDVHTVRSFGAVFLTIVLSLGPAFHPQLKHNMWCLFHFLSMPGSHSLARTRLSEVPLPLRPCGDCATNHKHAGEGRKWGRRQVIDALLWSQRHSSLSENGNVPNY